MPDNGLLAPPLTLRTNVRHLLLQFDSLTKTMQFLQPEQQTLDTESPNTSENGFSLQVPQPPSPRQSLGGDTLRSRADSFNSYDTEETVRSRANSNVSKIQARFEGDDWTTEEALRPDKTNENDFQVANNPFAFSPGTAEQDFESKIISGL